MATRNLFARSHLTPFRAWMAERGWVEQPTKSRYEVARWTHPEHPPLILWARETATVHVTVQNKDWRTIHAFLRDHHAKKVTT